jgi:hypothetical protein
VVSLKIFIFIFTGLLFLGIGFQDSLGENAQKGAPLKSDSSKPIPDWLNNNFRWYLDGQISQKELLTSINWLLDNNYMHLSEESAKEVEELRDQVAHLKGVLATVNKPIDEKEDKSGIGSSISDNLRILAMISEHQPKVNNLVSTAMHNRTQTFDEWTNVILQIRNEVSTKPIAVEISEESKESDPKIEDFQKVAILFNTAFDKESAILASEINLISEMPKIKALSQEDSSLDTFQGIEKNYWLGKLGKTNEKIDSLKTGVFVLQDYFNLIEPNLKSDITDSYVLAEIQKQKERIDKISSKLNDQQNTIETIIQNIRD